MPNDLIFFLGRALLGLFFIFNGLNHFTVFQQMRDFAEGRGVPLPGVAVAGTGLMLIAGGVSVLGGFWVEWGLGLLILFLVVVTPWIHSYWRMEDPHRKQEEQMNFMKNVGLLGALLMLWHLWG